ncbi:MAG: TPM domain-containing protein, partial [Gemmatimonadetes bacterium]|nr:TPM domain-containing protein [Gemmatimonadota bacterium]
AIATGTGAEGFVTDARAGRIRDAIGQAAAERGDYAAGLLVGVALLAEAYADEFGFTLTAEAPVPVGAGERIGPPPIFFVMMLVFFVLLLVVGASVGAASGRRHYRRHYAGPRGGLEWLILWTLLGGGRRRELVN